MWANRGAKKKNKKNSEEFVEYQKNFPMELGNPNNNSGEFIGYQKNFPVELGNPN